MAHTKRLTLNSPSLSPSLSPSREIIDSLRTLTLTYSYMLYVIHLAKCRLDCAFLEFSLKKTKTGTLLKLTKAAYN